MVTAISKQIVRPILCTQMYSNCTQMYSNVVFRVLKFFRNVLKSTKRYVRNGLSVYSMYSNQDGFVPKMHSNVLKFQFLFDHGLTAGLSPDIFC